MRSIVKLLVVFVFGSLALSPAVALLGLDPLPGDIAFKAGNSLINIPVAYSLCATMGLTLLTYFLKR
jgi:hypothetical protein